MKTATSIPRHKDTNDTSQQPPTMDQLNVSPEMATSLQSMGASDKQELNQFIQGESQKAQIQAVVHSLTDTYVVLPPCKEPENPWAFDD